MIARAHSSSPKPPRLAWCLELQESTTQVCGVRRPGGGASSIGMSTRSVLGGPNSAILSAPYGWAPFSLLAALKTASGTRHSSARHLTHAELQKLPPRRPSYLSRISVVAPLFLAGDAASERPSRILCCQPARGEFHGALRSLLAFLRAPSSRCFCCMAAWLLYGQRGGGLAFCIIHTPLHSTPLHSNAGDL
jgi:hypothetical protein